MKFKEFLELQENSLYTDSATKNALLADKERVMDSLMFNFFGFLGLYKLSDTRGYMKSYETTEGELTIHDIGDTNHDVSLSIKLAYDAGLLNLDAVNKMTRLLIQIKQKKLKSEDLDETSIRGLLDEIHYTTHKPSLRVFSIIQAFHNGALDLPNLAKELYQLAKLREYKSTTKEFRNLVLKGQYNSLFVKLKSRVNTISDTAAAPEISAVGIQNANKQNKSNSPKADKLTPPPSSKLGQTDEFMDGIFEAKDQAQFKELFKTYDVKEFDFDKFAKWFKSSKNKEKFPPGVLNSPLCKWLLETLNSSTDEKVRQAINDILEKILVNFVSSYTTSGDIRGFLEAIKDIDLEVVSTIEISRKSKKTLSNSFDELLDHFVSDIIGNAPDFSDATLAQLRKQYRSFKAFAWEFGVEIELSAAKAEKFFDAGFNKISVYVLALDLAYLTSAQIDYVKWLEKAFGSGSVIIKANGSSRALPLILKKSAYDKAPEEAKQAFQLLIRDRVQGAKIVDDDNAGVSWAKHWIHNVELARYGIYNEIDKYNEVDLKAFTEKEIDEAYEVFAALTPAKLTNCVEVFCKFDTEGLSDNGRAYLKNLAKVFAKLIKAGKVKDTNLLVACAAKDGVLFDAVTEAISNDNEHLNNLNAALENISSTSEQIKYGVTSGSVQKIYKWYTELADQGKVTPTADIILDIIKFKGENLFLMPKQEDVEKVFSTLKGRQESIDYLRWLVKQDTKLREKIIKYNETASHGGDVNPDEVPYSAVFLSDKEITDGIIENFKQQWLTNPKFNNILDYTFSEKLTNACRETMKRVLETSDSKPFILKALSAVDGKTFNDYFNNTDISKVKGVFSDSLTKPEDVANILRSIASDKKFIADVGPAAAAKFVVTLQQTLGDKKKFDKSYRDEIHKLFCEFMVPGIESNKYDVLEEIYKNAKGEFKKAIVDYFVGYGFLKKASEAIFRGDDLIKPYDRLDSQRLLDVLRYNNVNPPSLTVREAPTFKMLLQRADAAGDIIPDLKVEQVEHDKESLERKSVEYDVFNKYRHGQIAVKFLREFKVNIPEQEKGQQEFLKYMPNTDEIDPAFHGTGSIGASMILRYGFAVIKRGDEMVVGRMLGDGIYFSNVLDKVAQYVSDAGYTRGIGSRGYIFQMHALLGKEDVDYRAAGLGGDNIISPEWCVFQPNKQLKIYKAYEAEIISKNDMDALKAKYNTNEETAVKILSFKEFLREAKTPGKQVTTYVFVDGTIPISEREAVDFEQFKPEQFGPHVWLEPSQNGPIVCIEHDGDQSEAFCVRFTHAFMSYKDDLNKFLSLLRRKTVVT
jgi:hypothetical protein